MPLNSTTPNDPPLKYCWKCNQWLTGTAEYFYRDKKNRDGLWNTCKTCGGKKPVLVAREGHKFCIKCGKELPATTDFFYARKDSENGFHNACKTCRDEQSRAYREANRETLSQKDRQWREINADRLRERSREYRRKNAERLRETRIANTEQRREWMRVWREKNVEHEKEKGREYRKNNLDKLRLRNHIYVARKAALPTNFTDADWQFALDWWSGRCAYCGRPAGLFHILAMDHFVPLVSPKCPGTIPTNIVPACHRDSGCNNSKHDRDPEDWIVAKFGERRGHEILLKIQEFFSTVRA